jgi:hypothetical protein
VQKFLSEKFVTVWIDDLKDDLMAKRLGLPQEGYPNIAVYDADQDYVGRVIGFGGKDSWFQQVKGVVSVGDRLVEAKKKAEKDPAEWLHVAEAMNAIKGNAKHALEALGKVPPKTKSTKPYKTLEATLQSDVAWSDLDGEMTTAQTDAKTLDAFKPMTGKFVAAIDAFLKAHGGADKAVDAAATARKGRLLVVNGQTKEAADIVRKILEEYPDSDQARSILNAMR